MVYKHFTVLALLISLSCMSHEAFAFQNITWEKGFQPVSYHIAPQRTSLIPGTMRYEGISPQALQHLQQSEIQDFDASWESMRTFRLTEALASPLKIYIDKNPYEKSLYQDRYQQYVVDGMTAWADALDGRLKFELTDNPNQANITVSWVSSFSEQDMAGLTEMSIGRSKVQIKTTAIPDNLIKANIYHELGHALGIAGHSNDNNDIMKSGHEWSSYEEYKTYDAKLSPHDIAAIQHLYSAAWRKGEDLYTAVEQVPPTKVVVKTSSRRLLKGTVSY